MGDEPREQVVLLQVVAFGQRGVQMDPGALHGHKQGSKNNPWKNEPCPEHCFTI